MPGRWPRGWASTTVVIPPRPGLCSAFGAAIAEPRVDRVADASTSTPTHVDLATARPRAERLREAPIEELARSVDAAATRIAQLRATCATPARTTSSRSSCPTARRRRPAGARCSSASPSDHERHYGFALPGRAGRVINLPARDGARPSTPARRRAAGRRRGPRPRAAPRVVRRRRRRRDARSTAAPSLEPASAIDGPAVIEETDSTTLVCPRRPLHRAAGGQRARVEPGGARHELIATPYARPRRAARRSTTRSPTSRPRWRS